MSVTKHVSATIHKVLHQVIIRILLFYIFYFASNLHKQHVGLDSFSVKVTHPFNPEGSVPFVTLHRSGCYSFSLALMAGYGITKRCPEASLVLQK